VTFRDLHDGELPFLLPNAWDVASALAFAAAGFRAVGTTSFGVAAAAGHPDGGRSTRDATAALAAQLARLPVPVSADVEDGYDDDPDAVAAYVAGLGVAGINIEDSSAEQLIAPDAHAAKVAAIKRAAPDVFVNARVDTYWLGQDATVAATLARAAAYVEAGADGVFVPGATEPAELRELGAAIPTGRRSTPRSPWLRRSATATTSSPRRRTRRCRRGSWTTPAGSGRRRRASSAVRRRRRR
jgi:2-methylisocitrate lyase-like PEP mutase family enzyme